MPSYTPPKKNTAYKTFLSLVSQADTKLFQDNPTLAAGDVKVSIDGGASANIGTLPTAIVGTTRLLQMDLTAAEMNGDNVSILFHDAAGSEWCDLLINIQTSPVLYDDLPTGAEVADAVWDEALAGHAGAGSAGAALSAVPAASATADAVWDEALAGHAGAGSAGEALAAAGAGSTPADIADAVWDEALAGHAAAGSAGEALSAAGGGSSPSDIADAVWDEALSGHTAAGTAGNALTSASAGAGATTFTYTLTDSSTGLPIANARVWVTSDSAGTQIIASGTTDTAGQVVFYLTAGTVYVWRQKTGYNFTNPDRETVS